MNNETRSLFGLTLGTGALILIAVVALVGCGIMGMVVDTAINTHITQPLQRQNKNHDANWCIAQQQDMTATLTDFQGAQQRVPVDKLALSQYAQSNGDPKGYSYMQQQEYDHLQLVLSGDYQAEIRLAAHYNSLTANPDVLACFPHGLTTGLPDTLTADQPTA